MLDDGSDIGANDVPDLKPFNGRLMIDASGLADRVSTIGYCKFGNFREDFIFAKLRVCGVSRK